MYASNKIDVYKGVLSVNTRKGKSICEFAQHGLIYVHEYLCYDICIFVSMCLYTKSSKVWAGNGSCICKFAEFEFIYKVSIIRYMYICAYFHIYKEVQSVSVRQRTNMCEFAQLGSIYKSICSMIHVYLWTCMYIYLYIYIQWYIHTCKKRGSKCECLQGQEHMWYSKYLHSYFI